MRARVELIFGPERMAQVIDALPVGVFILDADGTAVYANAAAERLLGRGILDGDRAGNLSERYAAFVAGTNQPYPDEKLPIVRALQGERATVEDLEIERNGERIPFEVTATPLFDRRRRHGHRPGVVDRLQLLGGVRGAALRIANVQLVGEPALGSFLACSKARSSPLRIGSP